MKIKTVDWPLAAATLLLVGTGLALIGAITLSIPATRNFIFYQALFAVIGLVILVGLALTNYQTLRALSHWIWFVLILLLAALLFIPALGFETAGATRWIDLGFFRFQPSEIGKLVLILFLAKLVDAPELTSHHLIRALAALALPIGLTLAQPDFGTAMIMAIAGLAVILAARPPPRLLAALGVLLALLASILLLAALGKPPATKLLKPYQRERLITFVNPARDPFGAGYAVNQALIAVKNGGLFGRGLGYGSQSNLNFVPAKHTDFIFAVAAESLGFVGTAVIVGLFGLLIFRALHIAEIARDRYGSLVAIGIATLFLVQLIVNVGMNLGLTPVTGIPLPFLSYGGSALLTALAAVGILESIALRHKKLAF